MDPVAHNFVTGPRSDGRLPSPARARGRESYAPRPDERRPPRTRSWGPDRGNGRRPCTCSSLVNGRALRGRARPIWHTSPPVAGGWVIVETGEPREASLSVKG